MSRLELFSDGGYRHDGRRPLELRSIVGRTSVLPHPASIGQAEHSSEGHDRSKRLLSTICVPSSSHADGTAYLEHGLTQVLVFVHGPREPGSRRGAGDAQGAGSAGGAGMLSHITGTTGGPGSNEFNLVEELVPEKAALNVEFHMAPFSALERKKRGRGDRRLQELSASIRGTFESVVLTHLYPRSEIVIQIHVLQQDGAVLQCALNATTLALIDAGIAMQDFVVSSSVAAIIGKTDPLGARTSSELPIIPIVDVSGPEESDLPILTIATLYRSSQVCLLVSESRMHEETFKRMFWTGIEACRVIGRELDAIIGSRTLALARRIKGKGMEEGEEQGRDGDEYAMSDDAL